jgi:Zn-finger nucleic acid-binding protein
MNDMICPACQKPLKPKQVPNAMIIWGCDSCYGAAANISVLRKYLAGNIVKEFWITAIDQSAQSDRKCPCCTQPLSEFSTSRGERRISLDLCKKCQLIWFDKDELEAFPKTKAETASDIERQLALARIECGEDSEIESEGPEGMISNICFACFNILRLLLRLWLHF